MLELDMSLVKSWEEVKTGDRSHAYPKSIDIPCPTEWCNRSLVNLKLEWDDRHDFTWPRSRCVGCGKTVYFFLMSPPSSKTNITEQSHLYIHPDPSLALPLLTKEIEELSPAFAKIYQQAVICERENLDELVGVGYRKAIEFLIKDYLCQKLPDRAEEIKSKLLGPCIADHVTDQNVRDCVESGLAGK